MEKKLTEKTRECPVLLHCQGETSDLPEKLGINKCHDGEYCSCSTYNLHYQRSFVGPTRGFKR